MEDVHTGRFSTPVWNILPVIVVVIKIFFKQLARLEFKFCEDLKVSHKMQLFTAKTIINLHKTPVVELSLPTTLPIKDSDQPQKVRLMHKANRNTKCHD